MEELQALELVSVLPLGPAAVVRGKTGTLGGAGKLINQGLISADVAGGTLTVTPTAFTNEGVLRASDGGTLKIASAQFTDNGTREELNGGKIVVGP